MPAIPHMDQPNDFIVVLWVKHFDPAQVFIPL
jgi:hypothetical protein